MIGNTIAFLWTLGKRASVAMAILRNLVALLGTEQFFNLIESIRNATATEIEKLPAPPTTDKERIRLIDRIRHRMAMNQLGMTATQYIAFCDSHGISNELLV